MINLCGTRGNRHDHRGKPIWGSRDRIFQSYLFLIFIFICIVSKYKNTNKKVQNTKIQIKKYKIRIQPYLSIISLSLSLSVSFQNTKIQIRKVKNTKRPSWKTNMRPYLSISSWIDFEIQNTTYWENAKKLNIITSSGHIFHSFIFPNPSVREIQNTKKNTQKN